MKKIYYNGVIYTGKMPLEEAFVVENGHFIFSGDTKTALQMATSEDEKVDLNGRFVCSGFNDSHMHLLGLGKLLGEAQLAKHTNCLEDMLLYLKEYAKETCRNEWILGRGWNQDYFQDVDRMPNRWDLDKVSVEKPVCIVRACGHCLVVNSKALELLGITEETPQPIGGNIGIEDGVLNGRFDDNAMDLVYEQIPVPEKDEIKHMLRSACKALNASGITSCQTDDFCSSRKVPWNVIYEAYKELVESGDLTVRVYEQANLTNLDELNEFVASGQVTGIGNPMFKTGPLKMLGDGALGARTAYLSQPYADDASTCGIPVYSREKLIEMIDFANQNDMQVAVHAIGDACLDWVLEAFELALKKYPRENHRHGIVHCQITREDQLKKIRELNLHVYAQSIFLDYDIHIVEARVGKELASTSYCWKTLMNKGVTVSNGSDCPVEWPDVMAGIQCAVLRKPLKNQGVKKEEVYLPEECFTVQEAIDSYTIWSAYSSFEENVKGAIAPGMFADFVVLEKNPFAVPKEQIKDIVVCETYLSGNQVYYHL